MTHTFELKKGKLVFEKDKIVITDLAKNTRFTGYSHYLRGYY
jgi:hypothetical protein